MRPVINSEKRIVQTTLSTVLEGAAGGGTIVAGVQAPTTSDPRDVSPGTIVKAAYVELWVLATSQQPATMTCIITKLPAGAATPSAAEMSNLNGYVNKKNILYTTQGLVGDANTNPVPFIRQWIPIPKGKQRFGLGDTLKFTFKAITEDIQFCGVHIFKAYT